MISDRGANTISNDLMRVYVCHAGERLTIIVVTVALEHWDGKKAYNRALF